MVLEELCRHVKITPERLQYYLQQGLLQPDEEGNLDSDGDASERISLIHTLLASGMTTNGVKAFLQGRSQKERKEENLRALTRQRFQVLDEIHEKQQLLDRLDYMIHQMKNGRG